MHSVNPATEEHIATYPVHSESDVDAILDAAVARQPSWRTTPIADRCALLSRVGELLRERRDALAGLITAEMGKTIGEARAEVEKCAFTCDWFAAHSPEFLADQPFPSDSPRSFVAFEPLGTVLAGMPWNFPLWQVFRFAAPGLCAGNCAVLKHASNVSGCALAIAELFTDAGFPRGVFAVVLIPNDRVAAVIEDPRIAAVTLTGSTAAGRSVGAAAGRSLKPAVLELGGSDAFIVLEDADLAAAAATAAKARFQNAGQSCIAAKRFIVVESVAADFEELLVEQALAVVVGDPLRDSVTMGPLARGDLRAVLEHQLRESEAAGATLRCGGGRPEGRGYFITPAVLTGCTIDMPAFREETFGPLAAVMRVGSADEALAVANTSDFGLGGNIWTRDEERGVALARRLDSGGVFVNGMTHSDPRIPFGGVKDSGYGRELSSFGIREFVNVKTIWRPGPEASTAGNTPAE
ncbi:MAG: NAD-dependent succinate-semialdehyde dehydrogenase [Candidatus Dormibacteraeota bacterium]|uniref:NAD-dependent succinate-semialdehyde dehydrogenase n=2 Tax=Candidatus Aeolococcus gillhamiae TaxID=3127015 RepID=A0A2W5ZJS8_9BACT|nr:NAD-dependent succinate-semialdehyde dehydrogenase [Candidatus Dormibacteraeota bacterium]PZR83096.1 MAG: NADP-dependent succinic semialdehyde dehydrogenase [Candidatus Dormibacter sp. RRmetagenome_bin12]